MKIIKMKIVICGSMTFVKEMIEIEKKLIELGHEVILPKFSENYSKLESENEIHNESVKNKIDYDLIRDYFEEIKKSDVILVINKTRKDIDNYIGGNTLIEMAFAHVLHKNVYLFNPIPKMSYTDEIIAIQPIILNGDLSKIKND